MTNLLHRLRAARWLAPWLVLPALLLRAAIPEGFMPGTAAESASEPQATMQMCPGHSAMPGATQPGSGLDGAPPARKPGKPHHERPCVFASASALAFVAEIAVVVPELAPAPAPTPVEEFLPPQQAPNRAHLARGPPLAA